MFPGGMDAADGKEEGAPARYAQERARWLRLCYNGAKYVRVPRRSLKIYHRVVVKSRRHTGGGVGADANCGGFSRGGRMSCYSAITGLGMGVPQKMLTNADLERMVETSDERITARTGIKQRHVASPGETASTLAITAARQAMERAGIEGKDLDLIIVATVCPDYPFPSTACLVQHALGAQCGAF